MLNFSISHGLSEDERVDCRFAANAPEAFTQRPLASPKKNKLAASHVTKAAADEASGESPAHRDIPIPALLCRQRSAVDIERVTRPQKPQRWNRASIEVMPNCSLPLAGAKETLHAYRTDRCQHTDCEQCCTFLYCIESATMVLCPECKAISAVESSAAGGEGLLGLGMTIQMLLSDPGRPNDAC